VLLGIRSDLRGASELNRMHLSQLQNWVPQVSLLRPGKAHPSPLTRYAGPNREFSAPSFFRFPTVTLRHLSLASRGPSL
jgi:hypothetical protein